MQPKCLFHIHKSQLPVPVKGRMNPMHTPNPVPLNSALKWRVFFSETSVST
jgi:hypothetical protein